MNDQIGNPADAFSRRAFLIAGPAIGIATLGLAGMAPAQSAGAVTITFDKDLPSDHGMAELLINQEPQGVLSAGCCMFLQLEEGTYDLTLRWSDYEVSTTFDFDGAEPVAFLLTADRSLVLLED